MGTRVRVRIRPPSSAKERVSATGVKIRPSTRWKVKIGRKATMMMAFENMIGEPSSTQVCLRACRRRPTGEAMPWCSAWASAARRTISASTITTALSMITPKSTAPSEIRLADTPIACIRMKANSSDSGMIAATMMAARRLRRKTSRIAVTSTAPTSRFSPTVATVWPMSSVRW